MRHIKLKPTKEIKFNFNFNDVINDVVIPEESIKKTNEYILSDRLADDFNSDISISFADRIVFGFDYLQNKKRIFLPEINPLLFFFMNAQMFFKMIYPLKKTFYLLLLHLKKLNLKTIMLIFQILLFFSRYQ